MGTGNRAVVLVAVGIALLLSGCASGHHPTIPQNTTVTVNFAASGGTPTAVATKSGTSAFTAATPGAQVTFTVPQGTTTYAVAFVCPAVVVGTSTANSEHVIEATTQDTLTLNLDCGSVGGISTGTATGSVSSSISGTANIAIIGKLGFGIPHGFVSGAFSATLPTGSNDIALVALDSSGLILGVKILRSQPVPGAVNGGAAITILPGTDVISDQTVTVPNNPAGFNAPAILVTYNTANGTPISLGNSTTPGNPQIYAAIAPADAQSGDFYLYGAVARDPTTQQLVSINQTTTAGGGSIDLTMPTPWAFSGPSPAKFPTFTFIYSGFAGQAAVADLGAISWAVGTTTNLIDITATSGFQNGATTLTIPDLTSIPGFLASAPTGTTIGWNAMIFGGTAQQFTFPSSSPNATVASVGNGGTFTEP